MNFIKTTNKFKDFKVSDSFSIAFTHVPNLANRKFNLSMPCQSKKQ